MHNIVDVDCKKQSDSERDVFNFHIKKVSVYDIDDNIIEEIHKFFFLLQNLLIKEACAIMNKIKKGKGILGLIIPNYYCLF